MECENRLCIYWEDNQCILKSISLDAQGKCQSEICVEIAEPLLYQARKARLGKYQTIYEGWEEPKPCQS